jgi:hypothetical protein
MVQRFPRLCLRTSRFLAVLAVAAAASSPFGATGCKAEPAVVAVRDESHPPGGKYVVTATLQGPVDNRGYYSAAVTIHNETSQTLFLKPSMFRLEGTAPTSFVAADRIPMMFGRASYHMPPHVDARCSVQGEIFYGIRGSEVPKGPVRFVAELPGGEHVFEWNVIQ